MMKKKKERDDWPGLVVPHNSTRGCSSDSKDGRPAVLLTTGSFNPITRAHVEILEIAKRAVEKDFGYRVIKGYISPTHDHYVKSKCIRKKCTFVPSVKRVKMSNLALKESSDWIHTSTWECTQRGFVDYERVIEELRKHLDSMGMNDVAVLYVCGSDHARFCGRGFGAKGKGLVVVPREGQAPHKTSDARMVYGVSSEYVKETNTADISSTLVRKVLNTKPVPIDELNRLLYKSTISYIMDKKLYIN